MRGINQDETEVRWNPTSQPPDLSGPVPLVTHCWQTPQKGSPKRVQKGSFFRVPTLHETPGIDLVGCPETPGGLGWTPKITVFDPFWIMDPGSNTVCHPYYHVHGIRLP